MRIWKNKATGDTACESVSSEALQDLLVAAIASNEQAKFSELCDRFSDQIVREFMGWRKIPDRFRINPSASKNYSQMLISLARKFADKRQPHWRHQLTVADDVIVRIEVLIDRSNNLFQAGRFEQAIEAAKNAQATNRASADAITPITENAANLVIASSHFHLGRMSNAASSYELALSNARTYNESIKIATCLESLYEVNRYVGNFSLAADYATDLATQLRQQAKPEIGNWWSRQSDRVRGGEEPLLRLQAMPGDAPPFELNEVPLAFSIDKPIRLRYARNRPIVRRAADLVGRGRQIAPNDSVAAIAIFHEASRIDPFDPSSHYELARTLVRDEQYELAIQEFQCTEQLAPGWENCRADLWMTERVIRGMAEGPEVTAIWLLEEPNLPLQRAECLVDPAWLKAGNIPAFHLHRGAVLQKLNRGKESIDVLQQGLLLDPDPDTRSRLLLRLQRVLPNGEERTSMLREVASLKGGNLVAAAEAILILSTRQDSMQVEGPGHYLLG